MTDGLVMLTVVIGTEVNCNAGDDVWPVKALLDQVNCLDYYEMTSDY